MDNTENFGPDSTDHAADEDVRIFEEFQKGRADYAERFAERAEAYAAKAESATASEGTDHARRVVKDAHETIAKSRAVAAEIYARAIANAQEALKYAERVEQAALRVHEAECRPTGLPMGVDEIRAGLLAALGVEVVYRDEEKRDLYIRIPVEHQENLSRWLEATDTGWNIHLPSRQSSAEFTKPGAGQPDGTADAATSPDHSGD